MRYRNMCVLSMVVGILASNSACSTSSELAVTLHQSDRGKVSLVRVPNKNFLATHPITLPDHTIARVLRGVLVREDQGSLGGNGGSRPASTRVFSDEDVTYLAPLIEDGLKRATTDQQIVFTIDQTDAPVFEQRLKASGASPGSSRLTGPAASTSGSMYVNGRSLLVTLTQYRYTMDRPDTGNMADRLPDQTGLANLTVQFTPQTAQRPESYRDSSTDSTLIIDYERLARLPVDTGLDEAVGAAPTHESAASPSPTTSHEPVQRDPEVEALRRELEDIKRRLAEQEAQSSGASPKKPRTP